MFYKSLDQILMLALTVLVLVFFFLNLIYQIKKQSEYNNDERWKMILLKAKSIISVYTFIVATVIGFLFTMIPVLFDFSIQISVTRLATLVFDFLMLQSMIEYFAIRYFDKRL